MTDLTIEQAMIADLRPHPENPRNGDSELIAESLTVNGQYKPIVVAKDGTVIAGNHTYAAALSLGWEQIAVVRLPVTAKSKAAKRIMLADNRTADVAAFRYDDALLIANLRELDDALEGTGYTPDDLERLLTGPGGDTPPDDFPVFDDDLPTEYKCPSCEYEWSGKAKQ